MTESLVVTMSNPYGDATVEDNKIGLTWVSAAGGTVTQSICSVFAAAQVAISGRNIYPTKLKGFIVRVVTDPGATAPTDDYDITLTDANSVDVMASTLANRDTANTEQVIPSDPPYIDSELTLNISAAGDTKGGTIILYMTG